MLKNHSGICTRTFYQDNVVEHLKSQKVTDDDKVKMLKTLKKFEEENSVDIGMFVNILCIFLYKCKIVTNYL